MGGGGDDWKVNQIEEINRHKIVFFFNQKIFLEPKS